MRFELREPGNPWTGAETLSLLRRIYNHEVSRQAEIRVNGSSFWTARLWASVMRNPFPKRSDWTDVKQWSVRINPWTPEEFQAEVAASLAPEALAAGLILREQVSCETPLYNPRLDIALFRDGDCARIYECKWVDELRPGEVLQAITYKVLFARDVVLAIPGRALISRKAASMIRAAGIEVRRFGKKAPRSTRRQKTDLAEILARLQRGP